MNITEITVPLQEAAWLPWAVQYFFFIGVSAAAVLVAAAGDLGGGERWKRIQAPALLLALSAVVVAPVALLADLHQPGRFWHFYAHPAPWSWMSIGAILLPLYFGAVVAYALLWQREQQRRRGAGTWLAAGDWSARPLLPWLAGVTVAAALGILLYTGSEIRIVEARPLWHTHWLPVNLFLTALVASLGAIVFLQRWVTGGEPAEQRFTLWLFLAALVLTALGAAGWAAGGWLTDGVSFAEAMRLFRQFGYWQLLFYGSGLVGILLLAATVTLLRRPGALGLAWLLAPVALLAAWSFRWAVLMDVQTVPKYGAGLYPYELPLGSDGLLGIVGTFGLWAAVLVILTSIATWGSTLSHAGNIREVAHG